MEFYGLLLFLKLHLLQEALLIALTLSILNMAFSLGPRLQT